MKNYFVYFRRLGNMKADIHCMKVEVEGIKEAKNKVREILNRKFKEFVIIFVSETEIEL